MSRRPARGLTQQDRAIWAGYAVQVRALPGREVVQENPQVAVPATQPSATVAMAAAIVGAARKPAKRPQLLVIGQAPAGVDKSTWQRFSSGKLPIARRLDLHGHTAQRAFDRFEHVLLAAAAQGVRCIEVITGAWCGGARRCVAARVPLWLNLPHLRPLILAASHPHAANDGAVLLLLRRPREPGAGLSK